MATTKLTLSVSKEVLDHAKIFSKQTKQSLSALVSRYFSKLSLPQKNKKKKLRVSKNVKRLTGLVQIQSHKSDKDLLWSALQNNYLND